MRKMFKLQQRYEYRTVFTSGVDMVSRSHSHNFHGGTMPGQSHSRVPTGTKNRAIVRSKKTVQDLDLDASIRQAFGGIYARPKNLEESLEALRSGKLVLPPQPVWTGDPTDWVANPFDDRNWRFQHHTLRWMNPLRWAAIEGDKDAKAEWLRIARSWGETNTPAEASPSDFAWRDMADGNRAIQLCIGAPLAGPEDSWFVELLEYHRDWLMDPTHIVGKNHGLHQHQGLLVLGAVLRDQNAIDTAVSRMRTQFKTTFDVQGTNNEGSSAYHQMNMTWWGLAWNRASLEGITPPLDATERLASAAHVLAHIALPDGQIPQIGDSKRTRVALGYSPHSDFVSTGGQEGVAPTETAIVLDRGYIASRSGWGNTRPLAHESHTLIKYGEDYPGHSHEDRGSVNIYTQGQRWLIDPGFHSYQNSIPEVKYLKSREAHNVASIPGVKYDRHASVDLVSHSITENYHDFLLLDRGYKKHDLTRRVTYFTEADCWIISDKSGPSSKFQISQTWNIEPGVKLRFLDDGFRLHTKNNNFGMYWLGKDTIVKRHLANEKSLEGWIGTSWKTMFPSARITATSSVQRPHIVSLFGGHSPQPLSIVESHVASNGAIMAHVARGLSHWRIQISEDDISIRNTL